MSDIHSTAIVASGAELGEGVCVGPYCVIGPQVKVGAGTRLVSHVVIDGRTTLGAQCTVFPFASLGAQTQDLKYKGGNPPVEIGDRTTLREYVTVNAPTFDEGLTKIGSNCHIMAYSHIAHDCVVGDRVIIANALAMAGHVIVEDDAIVGGMCGIHQFVRVGRLSIIGGCAKVVKDVPPYMMADGNPLEMCGPNMVGLSRHGISEATQRLLKEAYRIVYRQNLSTRQAVEKIEAEIEMTPEIRCFIDFIKGSERGITK